MGLRGRGQGPGRETEAEGEGLAGSARRLLVQAGYDPDVRDHDGWTPLHAAAHWGAEEACSILAEALCNMDARDKLVSAPGPLTRRTEGWLCEGCCRPGLSSVCGEAWKVLFYLKKKK